MVKDRVLPEKEIIGWRAADGEAFPTANTGEIVVFEPFFYRGFSVPTSRFFRGLLHFYKIELVHLNPNSILHISTFIHLCEAYLGIEPHFALFFSPSFSRDDSADIWAGRGLRLCDCIEEIKI